MDFTSSLHRNFLAFLGGLDQAHAFINFSQPSKEGQPFLVCSHRKFLALLSCKQKLILQEISREFEIWTRRAISTGRAGSLPNKHHLIHPRNSQHHYRRTKNRLISELHMSVRQKDINLTLSGPKCLPLKSKIVWRCQSKIK